MQLQFEAMQSYKDYAELTEHGLDSNLSHLPDPEELEAMLENTEDEMGSARTYEQVHPFALIPFLCPLLD